MSSQGGLAEQYAGMGRLDNSNHRERFDGGKKKKKKEREKRKQKEKRGMKKGPRKKRKEH